MLWTSSVLTTPLEKSLGADTGPVSHSSLASPVSPLAYTGTLPRSLSANGVRWSQPLCLHTWWEHTSATLLPTAAGMGLQKGCLQPLVPLFPWDTNEVPPKDISYSSLIWARKAPKTRTSLLIRVIWLQNFIFQPVIERIQVTMSVSERQALPVCHQRVLTSEQKMSPFPSSVKSGFKHTYSWHPHQRYWAAHKSSFTTINSNKERSHWLAHKRDLTSGKQSGLKHRRLLPFHGVVTSS